MSQNVIIDREKLLSLLQDTEDDDIEVPIDVTPDMISDALEDWTQADMIEAVDRIMTACDDATGVQILRDVLSLNDSFSEIAEILKDKIHGSPCLLERAQDELRQQGIIK